MFKVHGKVRILKKKHDQLIKKQLQKKSISLSFIKDITLLKGTVHKKKCNSVSTNLYVTCDYEELFVDSSGLF